ncbi:hypothetical protein [Heyndrickxia acidicola]|uniref:Uncharacterized protein n=1 Tax=Heyndrickxia acidicola TaxID=209389 RepID=A0ABU6MFQ1_9BACI|nr:hypothetical protein [Heyndrickxia acidicola]MED1203238.1 hypothetical protein [Heyndrickxia acidicola]
MEEKFNQNILRGFLVKGELHNAVSYLNQFPSKHKLVERYLSIFNNVPKRKINNGVIKDILNIYYTYYKMIFWERKTPKEGEKFLVKTFSKKYGFDPYMKMDELENYLKGIIENEGYFFVGGYTSGFFGPYIWEKTEEAHYKVNLLNTDYHLTVKMMDGFISRSWLDFISLGTIGTGGWASENGDLYCVRKSYSKYFDKPRFKVSYLKHEAQHALDKKNYGDMLSKDLEYRAKLIELIYFPDIRKFKHFFYEADGSSKENAHSYASFVIVRDLSRYLFNKEYELDYAKWRGKSKIIKKFAEKLLNDNTKKIETSQKRPIDII